MKRNDWSITAIAIAILIALAVGCLNSAKREREFRNGQWINKEVGR